MADLRATIAKVARSQAPVYIAGESGTGKELVARTIHDEGARAAGPFVPVNCGAIPAELMESEFFGHKKGSFTGAHADKPGLFQAADGGTLFLDEVAELPLPMQVKLLRAIQEKSVRPVGANGEVPVDVRILSATHKNLAELVADGRFRHDLYYRINVIELRVPPLRERRERPAAAGRRHPGPPGPPNIARAPTAPDAVEALAATPSRATCANWRTSSNAPSPWPTTTASAPPTCACPKCAPAPPARPPPPRDRPVPDRPARIRHQRPAQLHRGNRAQGDRAGAYRQPLQQDPRGRSSSASPSARCATS
jgi:hypothetical protein